MTPRAVALPSQPGLYQAYCLLQQQSQILKMLLRFFSQPSSIKPFGQGHTFHTPANPNSYYDRGHGWTCIADCFHHKPPYASTPSDGLSIFNALMFSLPKPLAPHRSAIDLLPLCQVYDRRCIVSVFFLMMGSSTIEQRRYPF